MYPPTPVSLALKSSIFHLLLSAYLEYILNKFPANRAASSPPAPPLISTITFFSSLGSFGSRSIFNSASSGSTCPSNSDISIFANSLSSSSDSSSKIDLDSLRSFNTFLYSLYLLTIGSKSACSFIYFCQTFWSFITSISLIFSVKSIYLSSKTCSLSNIPFTSFFVQFQAIHYITKQCL